MSELRHSAIDFCFSEAGTRSLGAFPPASVAVHERDGELFTG